MINVAMNYSAILKRVIVTGLVAVLIAATLVITTDIPAWSSCLLLWPVLFFTWWYLSRRFGKDFAHAPKPPRKPTPWARMLITCALAFLVASGVAFLIVPDSFVVWFLFFWIAFYYSWPPLSRRLPFLKKTPPAAPNSRALPVRPLWQRVVRKTLVSVGVVLLVVVAIPFTVMLPATLCFIRARRVHDSIHIGMTVPEVLHVSTDTDIFRANSDFPHDDQTDVSNLPVIHLSRTKDGVYHTIDPAQGITVNLSESEAVDRMHARLHDGYSWHFHYTYINATPQHVSFTVDFGPDGRVSQVRPVYGWD